MVVNILQTLELEDVQVAIPAGSSPPLVVVEEKRPSNHRREKVSVERPPFVNYASSFIHPYVDLKPLVRTHRRTRSKSQKRTKRRSKRDASTDDVVLNETESKFLSSLYKNDLIDLWPSDSNAFKMEFLRQRQIVLDEPIETTKPTSLDDLKTWIDESTTNKSSIDRIWMIFSWICENIRYDLEENDEQIDVDEIFRSKKSSAKGYATLFEYLCGHLRIPCVTINGFVKDHRYEINQLGFSHRNHTWNGVQLENQSWYLLDSAWACASLDLRSFYFLVRPEELIYDHFPDDPRWQLLRKPISMLEFLRLPFLHPSYFTCQLTMIFPQFASLIAVDPSKAFTEVLVQAPDDVQITSMIKDAPSTTSLTQFDAQRRLWQCVFSPDRPGFHTLLVFVHRPTFSSPEFVNAIELGMQIRSKDLLEKISFPFVFGKFVENRCQIVSPLNGILRRGTKVTIHCRIPNAVRVRLALDGEWLDEVPMETPKFKQKIRVPKHEVIVYARFPSKRLTDVYDGLIRYAVH